MKNAVVWSEIAVSDLKLATAFCEKLLDSKLKAETFGPISSARWKRGSRRPGA